MLAANFSPKFERRTTRAQRKIKTRATRPSQQRLQTAPCKYWPRKHTRTVRIKTNTPNGEETFFFSLVARCFYYFFSRHKAREKSDEFSLTVFPFNVNSSGMVRVPSETSFLSLVALLQGHQTSNIFGGWIDKSINQSINRLINLLASGLIIICVLSTVRKMCMHRRKKRKQYIRLTYQATNRFTDYFFATPSFSVRSFHAV